MIYLLDTVNVDIFMCINLRGIMKMCKISCIRIRLLSKLALQSILIFMMHIFSRYLRNANYKKIYTAKISSSQYVLPGSEIQNLSRLLVQNSG